MRNKLTIILFGLLLAVGWTNTAQAQRLADKPLTRYGVKPIAPTDGKVPLSMLKDHQASVGIVKQSNGGEISNLSISGHVNAARQTKASTMADVATHFDIQPQDMSAKAALKSKAGVSIEAVQKKADSQSSRLNAPKRAPLLSLSKEQAAELKYSWENPVTHESGTDVSATEVAKDPYQIYEFLKYVYTEPSFPGPYYNAYTSNGQPEDPVYYGGIEGGWDIPYGAQSETPTTLSIGNITIKASSANVYFKSIYVYDANTGAAITSWTYNGSYNSFANNGTTYYYYVMPTGWTVDDNRYFLRSDVGSWYSSNYVGLISSGSDPGSITIGPEALGDVKNVRVVISAFAASSGQTITINNDTWSVPTSQTSHTWNVNGITAVDYETTPTDVLITLKDSHTFVNYIEVSDARTGKVLTSWVATTATLPTGWYASSTFASTASTYDGYSYRYMNGGGTIRIPANLFAQSDSINVFMAVRADSEDYTDVNLMRWDRYYHFNNSNGTLGVGETVRFPRVIPSDTYKPTEGYTALIVAVKNQNQPCNGETFLNAWEFTQKEDLINYIANNIDSVKLLTDGMRIGDGEGVGTVFNCDGTYNKFFFLSKGRARKKASAVYTAMGLTNQPWPSYACEEGPFKFMFEQFSPTSGARGSQIEDFYSEMMDGHVYNVVHDCASVIQTGHQFSLTGNAGTGSFAFKGMNFFIPDYRLKYWVGVDSIGVGEPDENGEYESYNYVDVDGRDMNSYMLANATGLTGVAFEQSSDFAVNYAQYNPEHAPKVGIYLITLEATAKPTTGYDPDDPSTRFFDITLTWTSSLDEMTNSSVPQSFTIYYLDDKGDRHLLGTGEIPINVTNPTGSLTLTYPWPQEATSQTFTYIVEGRGTGDHSPFVAWSNQDDVTIPGYDDFLALGQEHIESDFDIHNQCNWYRNFLLVSSENELNGLKYTEVAESPNQQMQFKLYRSVVNPAPTSGSEPEEVEVATLTFKNPTATTVDYEIVYSPGQEIEPYTLKKNDNTTVTGAYERDKMGIDDYGTLRVIGNGDLVIQPNGYNVNFKSITVKNGDNVVASWTVADGDITAGNSAWNLSPGSMWVEHMTDQGEKTYYLEGGGYLYIPNLLNQYNQLTVEIEAFGDGSTIARVLVNDESQRFQNNTPEVITWTVNRSNRGGNNAPIIKSNN